MNVIVVDTSSLISYLNGNDLPDLDLALSEGRVFLPPIVAAELLSGKLSVKQFQELFSFLSELQLCTTTLEHWARVGELRAKLSRRGIAISTPDAHVAQCALDIDGYLASKDKIFNRIAKSVGLKVVDA